SKVSLQTVQKKKFVSNIFILWNFDHNFLFQNFVSKFYPYWNINFSLKCFLRCMFFYFNLLFIMLASSFLFSNNISEHFFFSKFFIETFIRNFISKNFQ